MAEKKTEFLVLVALAVILIVGLVEFGERSPQHSTPPVAPSAPASATTEEQGRPNQTLTEAQRTYIVAAGSYLKTSNEEGMRVAQAMAGASNGSSTLGDIRDALSVAKRVEMAGFEGDYRDRINGVVPKEFTGIAKNITEGHRLFQAAMREFLEYWSDQNTEHIISGQQTLKRSITLLNATTTEMTGKMTQLEAKH